MIVYSNWRRVDRFSVVIGDVRETLSQCPSETLQCMVTSPPYYQLRDYECEGQLGLEKTPEMYIDNLVEVFREVRRILRSDGIFWLNLGDKYSANGSGSSSQSKEVGRYGDLPMRRRSKNHLRAKNLLGLPWRIALAMQADGWNLRGEIIWDKMNPMVESAQDRPPREHEHVFMFTKGRHYYYDRFGDPEEVKYGDPGDLKPRRTVWEIGTQKSYARHFAMFPTKLPERCFRLGASLYGCCPDCRTPFTRAVDRVRVATRPGKTSMAYRPANWNPTGKGADSKELMLDGLAIRGQRDPDRHVTKYTFRGWRPGCSCKTDGAVPCLVGDPFHGAGRSLCAADRLSLDYLGFEIDPRTLDSTMLELEADRKKRSKAPRKKRLARPYVQVPLIEEAHAQA